MARILILTPQLPIPPQALTGLSQGTTIRNFNLIAGLARRHEIDLLTFGTPAPDEGPKTKDERGPSFVLRPSSFVDQSDFFAPTAARSSLSRRSAHAGPPRPRYAAQPMARYGAPAG